MKAISLILVDGNNFLYRAFHATFRAGLHNSRGEPTGAAMTFINMLNRLCREYPKIPLAIVFDAKGKCFRHELFKEYKANRKPMPDDLRVQVPWVEEIIAAAGWPIIRVSGVEADDVLGSYAAMARAQGKKILIASGDKDLAALVGASVQIVDTMKNEVLDRQAVIDKFGVPPELIRDFLALKGDSADNIPGMSGIGDVAASCLLNNIGDLDTIKDNLEKVASLSFRGAKKFAEKFKEQEEVVMLSRKLATIKTDVELPTTIDSFPLPQPNHQKLLELYKRFEFKELAKQEEKNLSANPSLEASTAKDETLLDNKSSTLEKSSTALANANLEVKSSILEADFIPAGKAQIVTTLDQLKQLCTDILAYQEFAFFCFDTGIHFMEYSLVGMAFLVNKKAFYIPLTHSEFEMPGQLERNFVLETLQPIFMDATLKKVTFDSKKTYHILKRYNQKILGVLEDVLLESHLLDSNKPHTLAELATLDLSYTYKNELDICGKGANAIPLSEAPAQDVLGLAGDVVSVVQGLHQKYIALINQDMALATLYYGQELPLARILYRVEENGVNLDVAEFARQEHALKQRMEQTEQKIYTVAGRSFNISSPAQVGQVLFGDLGMPCKKKSAGGKPSTSEEVLTELAESYEVPRLILEFRAMKKLLTTYIEKLPKLINPTTGRLHGGFNQDGTVTGRLSSSDPNLQNIPVRTEDGRMVRTGFAAKEGFVILAADYSQIELRILAHMADETNMQKAFAEGSDIHAVTAAQMHGLEVSEVTPELRRSAKAINFGLIYGMSTFGLAKQLHIENQVAKNYIASYFSQYPKVQGYMNSIKESAHQNGYVTTFSGRKIYVKDINSPQAMVRQAAERAAINAPIQGSAAEVIKLAMIAVDAWIQRETEAGTIAMIMQVHDELVFEVRADLAATYAKAIEDIMEHAVELKVKLEVGVGIGSNWGEAH